MGIATWDMAGDVDKILGGIVLLKAVTQKKTIFFSLFRRSKSRTSFFIYALLRGKKSLPYSKNISSKFKKKHFAFIKILKFFLCHSVF